MNEPTYSHSEAMTTTIRFSIIIAVATAIVTTVTFITAFLTPPLSGPLCVGACFEYPYLDIALRFPRDYYWMFPAMLVSLLFFILMICVHHHASNEKKLFSHIGVSFALMSAIILISNYFVQVTVIQQSLLMGETEGIALITQFNPHGVFIALEEIGFFFIILALFSMVPVVSGNTGLERALRWTWIIGLFLAATSFAFVSLRYGIRREYIFEIIIISIAWFEVILSSILLSRFFKRKVVF